MDTGRSPSEDEDGSGRCLSQGTTRLLANQQTREEGRGTARSHGPQKEPTCCHPDLTPAVSGTVGRHLSVAEAPALAVFRDSSSSKLTHQPLPFACDGCHSTGSLALCFSHFVKQSAERTCSLQKKKKSSDAFGAWMCRSLPNKAGM